MQSHKANVFNIVSYVVGGIAIILVLYCLFKVFNLSRKIHSVSDFVNGEIFSGKFHNILSNYFSDESHTKLLLEPIMPWIREIVWQECSPKKPVSPKKDVGDPVVQDMGGMFLIDG